MEAAFGGIYHWGRSLQGLAGSDHVCKDGVKLIEEGGYIVGGNFFLAELLLAT
jgi:hypothetical protein